MASQAMGQSATAVPKESGPGRDRESASEPARERREPERPGDRDEFQRGETSRREARPAAPEGLRQPGPRRDGPDRRSNQPDRRQGPPVEGRRNDRQMHLQQAAEHLRAAGMPELADRLEQRMRERPMGQGHQPGNRGSDMERMGGGEPGGRPGQGAPDALAERVERMEQEFQKIHEHLRRLGEQMERLGKNR